MLRLKHLVMCAAALLLAASGSAFAKHNHNTCFNTTSKMKTACRADIIDDYYEQLAKCLNSDEVFSCWHEAYGDLRDGRGECRDQAQARNSLCERLPDAGPYIAELDPDDFGGCDMPGGQNPYLPLIPRTVTTFVNDADEQETVIVTVTDETREIEGIEAIIVNDVVFEGLPDENGNPDPEADPIEDTDDYFAIDDDCNVWYLGEIAQNFEDGFLTDLDGSFIAGEEGAQAGIVMLANPQLGDVYRQEFALGDAEDAAEVLALDANIEDEDGMVYLLDVDGMGANGEDINCNMDCLQTEDFVGNELDSSEVKTYLSGVGVIAEQTLDGEVVLEMIKIEHPE